MRLINGKGPPHWRHGLHALACAGPWYDFGTGQSWPRTLACGAILRNGTGPARVGQLWRALGARCNGWIERLRAPQARGVTYALRPGKPLVRNRAALVVHHTPATWFTTIMTVMKSNYQTTCYTKRNCFLEYSETQ